MTETTVYTRGNDGDTFSVDSKSFLDTQSTRADTALGDPPTPPVETQSTDERPLLADVASKRPRNANFIATLAGSLQAIEVLCSLAILYLLKDGLHMNPASSVVLTTIVRLPGTFKLMWAILVDTTPLQGDRRRSYIVLGATLCFLSCTVLGFLPRLDTFLVASMLFIFYTGTAICSIVGEALLVEIGRGCAKTNDKSGTSWVNECSSIRVSSFFGSRKLCFALMAYLSGFLLNYLSFQHIFLVATIPSFFVAVLAWLLLSSTPDCTVPRERRQPLGKHLRRLWNIFQVPELLYATLFVFLLMATPSSGTAMFYFLTNALTFKPEMLGRLALFQALASLGAIISYGIWFKTFSLKSLLLWSTLLVTPFCFLPLILVKQWNLTLGISNSVFFLTDTFVMEFIGEFQTLPLLVLAAEICPVGLESSIYAVIITAAQLGSVIGTLLSAGLTQLFGITATNFDRLSLLIIVCAATTLLPSPLLHALPDKTETGMKPVGVRNTVSENLWSAAFEKSPKSGVDSPTDNDIEYQNSITASSCTTEDASDCPVAPQCVIAS